MLKKFCLITYTLLTVSTQQLVPMVVPPEVYTYLLNAFWKPPQQDKNIPAIDDRYPGIVDNFLANPTYQSSQLWQNIFHAFCFTKISRMDISTIISHYTKEEVKTALSQYNVDGLTPLHLAVLRGHYYLVTLFISLGADIAQKTALCSRSTKSRHVLVLADMIYLRHGGPNNLLIAQLIIHHLNQQQEFNNTCEEIKNNEGWDSFKSINLLYKMCMGKKFLICQIPWIDQNGVWCWHCSNCAFINTNLLPYCEGCKYNWGLFHRPLHQ